MLLSKGLTLKKQLKESKLMLSVGFVTTIKTSEVRRARGRPMLRCHLRDFLIGTNHSCRGTVKPLSCLLYDSPYFTVPCKLSLYPFHLRRDPHESLRKSTNMELPVG
jgi:hypothetical protein